MHLRVPVSCEHCINDSLMTGAMQLLFCIHVRKEIFLGTERRIPAIMHHCTIALIPLVDSVQPNLSATSGATTVRSRQDDPVPAIMRS